MERITPTEALLGVERIVRQHRRRLLSPTREADLKAVDLDAAFHAYLAGVEHGRARAVDPHEVAHFLTELWRDYDERP